MPLFALNIPLQVSLTLFPNDVTIPKPLTTTLLDIVHHIKIDNLLNIAFLKNATFFLKADKFCSLKSVLKNFRHFMIVSVL
jgi:hypothetical protein